MFVIGFILLPFIVAVISWLLPDLVKNILDCFNIKANPLFVVFILSLLILILAL